MSGMLGSPKPLSIFLPSILSVSRSATFTTAPYEGLDIAGFLIQMCDLWSFECSASVFWSQIKMTMIHLLGLAQIERSQTLNVILRHSYVAFAWQFEEIEWQESNKTFKILASLGFYTPALPSHQNLLAFAIRTTVTKPEKTRADLQIRSKRSHDFYNPSIKSCTLRLGKDTKVGIDHSEQWHSYLCSHSLSQGWQRSW